MQVHSAESMNDLVCDLGAWRINLVTTDFNVAGMWGTVIVQVTLMSTALLSEGCGARCNRKTISVSWAGSYAFWSSVR